MVADPHRLVLVPARGGSSRLPSKNLAKVGGLSLVARAIKVGTQVPGGTVVVSTDDPAIGREARVLFGALIHPRTPFEANGKQHRALVGKLALEWYARRFGEPSAVVLLQPTSPLREAQTVLDAVELFDSSGADTVCSVSPRPLETSPAPLFAPDGGVWVVKPDTLRAGDWYGPHLRVVSTPQHASIDVDTETDLCWVREQLKRKPKVRGH